MERMPGLGALMTPFPYSIGADRSIADARAMMDEHGIHHLPVTRAGELAGVLSDRDVGAAEPGDRVGERCAPAVYVVEMATRVDDVLRRMADQRLDAALVTRHGKLAGIFTTTDACRAFGDFLARHFPPDSDDDAA